jgi:hypothetical protein
MDQQALDVQSQDNTNDAGNEGTIDHYDNLKSSLPEDLQGHVTHDSFDAFVQDYADVKGKMPVVPENADGYQLDFGDDVKPYIDEGLMSDFRKVAHEAGFTQQQIDALKMFEEQRIAAGMESFTEIQEQLKQSQDNEKHLDDVFNNLKQQWGDKYEENREKAQDVFEYYLKDKGLKAEDLPASVTDNPYLVDILYTMGQKISEDTFVSGGGGGQKKAAEDSFGSPMLVDPKKIE